MQQLCNCLSTNAQVDEVRQVNEVANRHIQAMWQEVDNAQKRAQEADYRTAQAVAEVERIRAEALQDIAAAKLDQQTAEASRCQMEGDMRSERERATAAEAKAAQASSEAAAAQSRILQLESSLRQSAVDLAIVQKKEATAAQHVDCVSTELAELKAALSQAQAELEPKKPSGTQTLTAQHRNVA